MNAPIKHPSLDDLYPARKKLLGKQAEIAASREKLSLVDQEAEEEAVRQARHCTLPRFS